MASHYFSRWFSTIAAIALVASALTASADAQSYAVIQPPVNAAQARAISGQVVTILRDTAGLDAAEQKVLDDYFMRHLYPSMTQYDPAQLLGQLAEKREDLFGRYINQIRSQQAREHINTNTVKAMTAIAKGGYHPAARYNAALILGQLDAEPGVRPLPAGTEGLLSLLENDQFNNVDVPTAVKVAALIGLERHVRLGVDPAAAERITKAALAVANREQLPEDATAKTFGWVRRQAAEVLAAQFAEGLTPPAYQTFVRLIRNEKMELDDRCGVAELLQPTMFSGAEGLNLDEISFALGELAREVLGIEAEEAKDYLDEILATGGFAAAGGGRGGFGGEFGGRGGYGGEFGGGFGGEFGGRGGLGVMPMEEQGPKYEKRRMLDRTLAIVDGAQAVAAGGSDELKARLGEFATAIRTVAETAAADSATEVDVAKLVADLERNIDDMVAQWAPPQPAAGELLEEEQPEDGAEQPAPAAEGAPVDEASADEAPADEAAEPAEEAAEPAAAPAEAAP